MTERFVWGTVLAIGVLTGTPVPAQRTTDVAIRTEQTRDGDPALLSRPVTIRLSEVSLRRAIDAVTESARVHIGYRPELLNAERKTVSLEAHGISLRTAMEHILEGTRLRLAALPNGTFAIVVRDDVENSRQSGGTLAGRITDSASGKALANVNVALKGTKHSTLTDNGGRFAFRNIPVGDYVVAIRMLGYPLVQRTAKITGGDSVSIAVALAPSVTQLSDIVTTATGQQRRVEMGNSVTRLDVDKIRETAPITNIVDLLTARVPGLIDRPSSGTPGDPTRIRLRGSSSIVGNNDPIVIVDGARINAVQSDARSRNTAATMNPSADVFISYPAPSPLEQIDPNSVETIEVYNGPSATAMYGSDAANGVIVITTKKGKPGVTRWTFDASYGGQDLRVMYPDRYIRWGRYWSQPTRPQPCPITSVGCFGDSLVTFNSASDPALSPIGQGRSTGLGANVSGGMSTLTYNFTVGRRDELGLLKLPQRTIDQFRESQGTNPPGWMRRPTNYAQNRGAMTLNWTPNPGLSLTYVGTLSQGTQRRSSLEVAVMDRIANTWYDAVTNQYREFSSGSFGGATESVSSVYLPDAYNQISDDQQQRMSNIAVDWRPASRLTFGGNASVDQGNKEDRSLLRRGYIVGSLDSVGAGRISASTTTMSTLRGWASTRLPAWLGIQLTPTLGVDYTNTAWSDVKAEGTDLVAGTSSLIGARQYVVSDGHGAQATFGMRLQTTVNAWDRLFFEPAIRWDGGDNFGTGAKTFAMPKLGTSWLVSDESFFPFKAVVNALRLRMAYGQAGTQPGVTDRVRVYQPRTVWYNGVSHKALDIASFGNTQLSPERSVETEGGFDLGVFDDRVTLNMTWYSKMTRDALLELEVAPSVLGGSLSQASGTTTNIGRVHNGGFEIDGSVRPMQTRFVDWTSRFTYTRNRNVLKALGRAATFVNNSSNWAGGSGSRYVEGYPLRGFWSRPMVSYADRDHSGVIELDEVQMADSMVYIGPPDPQFTSSMTNTVALFNGAITASALVTYQRGATQLNGQMLYASVLSRARNDKTTPLATQAAYVSLLSEAAQQVSILRLQSMSVNYRLPQTMVRRLRAQGAVLMLQGANLGARSNYSGLEANVSPFTSEADGIGDLGMIPPPREWQLAIKLTY